MMTEDSCEMGPIPNALGKVSKGGYCPMPSPEDRIVWNTGCSVSVALAHLPVS